MLDRFHHNRFNVCKLPRQSGKSTIVVSYLLHYALFNDNVNIAILANKAATARDLLDRLQTAYENLPKWLQQGVLTWNKASLELENGSKIIAASTSASAVRGGSYNIIFLDEFAFVANHIADQFFSSVYPTISSGQNTKVIIVSTPHGMNHFYKIWHDARNVVRTNIFQLMFIGQKFLVEMRSGKNRQSRTLLNNSLRLSLSVNFLGLLIP